MWLKLADDIASQRALPRVAAALEPHQQGLRPTGLSKVIRCLRGWARQADDNATADPTAPARIIFSTDLENAFCRMTRSRALKETSLVDTGLARWNAVMWRSGQTQCWQRVDNGWEQDRTACGTPQGLRSGQQTFAVEASAGVRQALEGHDVSGVAIHDDWYFEMSALSLESFWPTLQTSLATRNHRMAAEKCNVLILAQPGSASYVAAAAIANRAGLPIATGHVDALGTALGGLRETSLEANGRPDASSLKFLNKRIAQLERDACACTDLLELSSHQSAAQVAWALLEGATSKALEYDLAMLPPRLTAEARGRADRALRRATEAFAGSPLTNAEWQQATLPLWLGGAGLGIFTDMAAAARYAASWLVSGQEAMDLAARLGRPLTRAPETEEMLAACHILSHGGINLCEQAVSLTPEAAAALMASPWSIDAPASTALARPDEPAFTAPPEIGSAGMPPHVGLQGQEGFRGITGRLNRAVALLEACAAAHGHDADSRANCFQHGGRGCGTVLHGLPREKHMRADRATFLIILRRRLRAPLAREDAICQLLKSSSNDDVAMPVAITAQQQGRSICGKPLGRHARHSCHCPCGPHRIAAHNSVVNALAHTLAKAGGSVQTERFVPELYMKRANGTWHEAVMDLAISWPLAPTLRLLDITLRSSHYRGAAAVAGAAAQHAHAEKHRRYGSTVQAVAIEVGGRMLPEAQETLRRLAVDSQCGRRWQARSGPRLFAHGLRRLVEWEALRGLAQATLAACGVHLQTHGRRARNEPAGATEQQLQQQRPRQMAAISAHVPLAFRSGQGPPAMMTAPAPDPISCGWSAQQASSAAQGTVIEAIALPDISLLAIPLFSAAVPLEFRSGQGPTALMTAPAPHAAIPQSAMSRELALSPALGTVIDAAALRRHTRSKFGSFCIQQLSVAQGAATDADASRTHALRGRIPGLSESAAMASAPSGSATSATHASHASAAF